MNAFVPEVVAALDRVGAKGVRARLREALGACTFLERVVSEGFFNRHGPRRLQRRIAFDGWTERNRKRLETLRYVDHLRWRVLAKPHRWQRHGISVRVMRDPMSTRGDLLEHLRYGIKYDRDYWRTYVRDVMEQRPGRKFSDAYILRHICAGLYTGKERGFLCAVGNRHICTRNDIFLNKYTWVTTLGLKKTYARLFSQYVLECLTRRTPVDLRTLKLPHTYSAEQILEALPPLRDPIKLTDTQEAIDEWLNANASQENTFFQSEYKRSSPFTYA